MSDPLLDLLAPEFVDELLDLARRFHALVFLVRLGNAWQPLLMPWPCKEN